MYVVGGVFQTSLSFHNSICNQFKKRIIEKKISEQVNNQKYTSLSTQQISTYSSFDIDLILHFFLFYSMAVSFSFRMKNYLHTTIKNFVKTHSHPHIKGFITHWSWFQSDFRLGNLLGALIKSRGTAGYSLDQCLVNRLYNRIKNRFLFSLFDDFLWNFSNHQKQPKIKKS